MSERVDLGEREELETLRALIKAQVGHDDSVRGLRLVLVQRRQAEEDVGELSGAIRTLIDRAKIPVMPGDCIANVITTGAMSGRIRWHGD